MIFLPRYDQMDSCKKQTKEWQLLVLGGLQRTAMAPMLFWRQLTVGCRQTTPEKQ